MAANEPRGHWSEGLQRAWLSRRGPAIALLPLSAVFGVATALRRALQRRDGTAPQPLPVPVIVVGNLVVGGAGKTPTVIAVVALLRRHGFRPGIVSRGHGGSHRGAPLEVGRDTPASVSGDEPLLLRLRTGAPLVVGRDRVAAARQLLRNHPTVDVVVSDDGLQHRALARDAQVIVFDERGAGNGWLLPAGPLREAMPARLPARTLVVYNAARPTTPLPGTVAERHLTGVVSLAGWWAGTPASMAALRALSAAPTGALLAAAGVARPERFFEMLDALGLEIRRWPLPDHFDYAALPWPAGTADVVVTEKDAIKIDPARIGATRVWVAPLDFRLDAAFDAALVALLPPPGTRHGNTPAEPARLPDLQGPA